MLDYTKGVLSKTLDDLKSIAFFSALALQIFQVGYLIFALCAGTGILVANIILLTLSTAYLAFMLYVHFQDVEVQTRKLWKNIYRWSKRAIKAFTLGVSIYGLFIAASEPLTTKSMISIVLVIFMFLAWILDILFSLIVMVVEKRKDLFLNAFKMDFEPAFKAVNFVNKIRGKEVEDEIVPTKSRSVLEKLNEKRKAQIKQKKADKKAAKAALKAAKKDNTPQKKD